MLVDVPGLHDPNEERQAAVRAHAASSVASNVAYHWLVSHFGWCSPGMLILRIVKHVYDCNDFCYQ